MNRVPTAISVAVAAAGLALAACSDAADTEATGDTVLDRGAEVYASSCASCHGAQLEGTDKGPPQISSVYNPNHHSDFAYESAIRLGALQHHWSFGDMEPIEGLSDDDVAAVIAFIRSEQERLGFEPYPPE